MNWKLFQPIKFPGTSAPGCRRREPGDCPKNATQLTHPELDAGVLDPESGTKTNEKEK